MIPKIIHHIAPKDQDKWHPMWLPCYNSWLSTHTDFKFMRWGDREDIDYAVRTFVPEFFDFYNELPLHISKIDFARLAILYEFGGIYADMDLFCYKQFIENIDLPINFLQSRFEIQSYQNSLLVCEKKHYLIYELLKFIVYTFNLPFVKQVRENLKFNSDLKNGFVLNTTGPGVLGEFYRYQGHTKQIGILDKNLYDPELSHYDETLFTKHLTTGLWGNDNDSALNKDYFTWVCNETFRQKCEFEFSEYDFYRKYK